MVKSLRIMEWNANGLLQHQHELRAILCTENIDICLIAETHFTKESFIRFQNYNTYHTIHPDNTARGGSAIVIKNNIM
jgi:exonuclease III